MKKIKELTEKQKRFLFGTLGVISGLIVFNLFFLLDYLFYLDPELEKALWLLSLICLGGFISGLIPLKIVDGIITGTAYSILFYIEMNLLVVFHYISLGLLGEIWEPIILARSLLYVLMTLACSTIGIGLRSLIRFLIDFLKNRITQ